MNGILLSTAMAAINIGGTSFLKLSADPQKQSYFTGSIVAYVIAAGLYLTLMKNNDLVVPSLATSILQMGLVISLGVWIGESVSAAQGITLLIAITTVAFAMLIPVL